MPKKNILILCLAMLLTMIGSQADALYFTIQLKNGNEINVEKYWGEGENIHFYSHGGSIALPKASIKTILKHDDGTLGQGTIEYAAPESFNVLEGTQTENTAPVPSVAKADENLINDIKDRLKVVESNISSLTEKRDFYLNQKNSFIMDKEKAEERIAKLKDTPFMTSEDLKERIEIEESQTLDAEEKIKEVDVQIKHTDDMLSNQRRVKNRLESQLAKMQ